MSAEDAAPAGGSSEFVVRPDGTVVGSDAAAGAVAAALPYTGRLARRTGELAGLGDLRAMDALGRRRLSVGVTWTPAGEGTYRASVALVEPRAVPQYMVVGATDSRAAVEHCLQRLGSVAGVGWSCVVTAGARVVAARGPREELAHVAEVGTRVLAILRSLEDQHAGGFVRLRFEQGAIAGATLGRHAVVASVGAAAEEELLALVDEVRAVLASGDLSAVPGEFDPDAPEGSAEPESAPGPAEAPAPPPLVGARFAGAGERAPRAPRRSFFRSR